MAVGAVGWVKLYKKCLMVMRFAGGLAGGLADWLAVELELDGVGEVGL